MLAGVTAAALGIGALGAADAHAAFTLAECQGSGSVRGQGASFQRDLQSKFKQLFEGSDGCDGTPAGPTYAANGSGNGIASVGGGGGNATLLGTAAGLLPTRINPGVRDTLSSFSATDEPLTPEQRASIEGGLTTTDADNGKMHLVPIATGSSAFIMRAPVGCDLSTVTNKTNGADGTYNGVSTGDRADNKTQRIRVTSTLLEKAFAGAADADTWGEIAPGISGAPTSPQYAGAIANCADVPVRRIVRQDVSGTTYGWKAYLNLINPGRNWLTTYVTPDNLSWPAAGGSGSATPARINTGSVEVCPLVGNKLCSGTSSGNGNLVSAINAVDGSIGYSDLATARGANFDITGGANQDYTFWSPLQTNPGGDTTGYAEPTEDPIAHAGGTGQKGAACTRVAIQNAPTAANSPNNDPTLGNWSRAFAAGGAGYPACVLTYILAWDDNAPIYGNTPDEEAKARTVKDYLTLAASNVGQVSLAGIDYSRLPNPQATPLQTWAQNAVATIDWNKTSGGGGTVDPPVVRPPVVVPPIVVPPVVNPPAAPSNAFSIPSSKTTSSLITFAVQLPGAGALKAEATTRVGRRTIKVANVSASATGPGRVTLRLKLSAAAKKALARAKGKKLKVAVKFTFTPAGGTANTVTRTVTVKAAARRAARRKAKR
ncbi:MAG TPA: hypothetical protein VLK58_08570 [Conexibacter sp.]|nr:hypothetical protein [Conexibacter sp.]